MNPLAMRWCPACGADAIRDEDGCCATCGATLISDEVLRAVVEAAEAEEREACAVACTRFAAHCHGMSRLASATAADECARLIRARTPAKGGDRG